MYKKLLLCAGVVFLSSGLRAMTSMQEEDELDWVIVHGLGEDNPNKSIRPCLDSGADRPEEALAALIFKQKKPESPQLKLPEIKALSSLQQGAQEMLKKKGSVGNRSIDEDEIHLVNPTTLEPEDDDENGNDPFYLMATLRAIGDGIQDTTKNVGNGLIGARENFSQFIELLLFLSDD